MENKTSEVVLPPQKLKSNLVLWVVVGIVILAAGVGIGLGLGKYLQLISPSISVPTVLPTPTLFLTVTPTETADLTADWKTYSNSEFGFSFKYPISLKPEISEGAQDRDFMAFVTNNDMYDPLDFYVSVYAEHPAKFTLGSYTIRFHDASPYANPPIQDGQYSLITTTTIAGKTANTFTSNFVPDYYPNQNTQFKFFLLSNGKYVFVIKTVGLKSNIAVDRILSTFKLIDNNTANSNGTITGKVCYPSEGIPAGVIRAKNADTGEIVSLDHLIDTPTFSFSLKSGTYKLRFEPGGNSTFPGYHTGCSGVEQACQDNTKQRSSIPVTVRSGKTTSEVKLCDFYYSNSLQPDF